MPEFIYTMKDLRKIVPPKREILKGIWLSFYHGAKIGVLGLNGAGKSSLLKIMAGIDTRFDGEAFHRFAGEVLPRYAAPVFVRILSEQEVTGTFKIRKVELVREGFDPAAVPDPLYLRDDGASAYVPLTEALHGRITSGELAL